MTDRLDELEGRIAALERAAEGDSARIEPLRLYDPAEAAALLGCSRANVYNLIQSGELARRAIGAGKKGFKVMGQDLLAFLDARKEGGPRPAGSFKYLRRPSQAP
jgi:excisionase family DNA binding protein